MNLNGLQVALIISAVLSGLMGATAQLTDIFGAIVAKDIVSGAALLNLILSSVLVPYTSQGAQIKSVAAMPGVARIAVNEQANPTLAAVATDPTQPKVGAVDPQTRATLINTVKGSS